MTNPTTNPTTLTEATVAALLAAQGYAVPDDLAEIAQNVNRLVDQARSWDAVAVRDDEPWPVWPTSLMAPTRDVAGRATPAEAHPDVDL